MSKDDLILNCNFTYQCPNLWDELEPTEDKNRRFCHSCQQNVHYVESIEDLEEATKKGYCIATKTMLSKPETIPFIRMGEV